jgi:hypothetical protein
MLPITDSMKKNFITEFNEKHKILQPTHDLGFLNDFFTLAKNRETLMGQIPGLLMNLLNLSDVTFYNKLFSSENLQDEFYKIKENVNKNIKLNLDQDIENISIAFNKGDYKETLLCVNKSFTNLAQGIEKFWYDLEANNSLNILSIKNGLILLSTYVMMNYAPIIKTLSLIVNVISGIVNLASKEDSLYNEATIFSNLSTLHRDIFGRDPISEASINSYQSVANIMPEAISSLLNLKLDPEKTSQFLNYISQNSEVALSVLKNLDVNQKNFQHTSTYPEPLKDILQLVKDPSLIAHKIKDIDSSKDSSFKKVISIYETIFKSFSNLPNDENMSMSENIKFKDTIGKHLKKLESDFIQQIVTPLRGSKELEKILVADKATELRFNSLIQRTNLTPAK